MKKLCMFFTLLSSYLSAYPNCAKELQPALEKISRFPEGKKLIEAAERDGKVQIYRASFNSNSPAMWEPQERAIVLNANTPSTFGEVIRSIFFELHNVVANSAFADVDNLARKQEISKSDYVEKVERLEHANAYACAMKINRAIQQGYFPQDASWPIPRDFETHFKLQQETGHAAKVAATYDTLIDYATRH